MDKELELSLDFSPIRAPGSGATKEGGKVQRDSQVEKKMSFEDELGEDFLLDLKKKNDLSFEPSPQKTGAMKKGNTVKHSDALDFDLSDFVAPVRKMAASATFDWTADLGKSDGFDLFSAFEIPKSPEKFRAENSRHVKAIQKGIEDLPVFKDPTEGLMGDVELGKEVQNDIKGSSSPVVEQQKKERSFPESKGEATLQERCGISIAVDGLDKTQHAHNDPHLNNREQDSKSKSILQARENVGTRTEGCQPSAKERAGESAFEERLSKPGQTARSNTQPAASQQLKSSTDNPFKDAPSVGNTLARKEAPSSRSPEKPVPDVISSPAVPKERVVEMKGVAVSALSLSKTRPLSTTIGSRLTSSLANASSRLASTNPLMKPSSTQAKAGEPNLQRSEKASVLVQGSREIKKPDKIFREPAPVVGGASLKRTLPMPEHEPRKDSRLDVTESSLASRLLSPKRNLRQSQAETSLSTRGISSPSSGSSRLQTSSLNRSRQPSIHKLPPPTLPDSIRRHDKPSQSSGGPSLVAQPNVANQSPTTASDHQGTREKVVAAECSQAASMEVSTAAGHVKLGDTEAQPPKELAEGIIKKGDIARKADEYTKELDQMYSSLKKKHEEAKDLLVKALINNNRLQMLNNPITEDKISAIERSIAQMFPQERIHGLTCEE